MGNPEPILRFELPRAQVMVRYLQQEDVRALEWHGGADLRSFYEIQWQRHCDGEICVLVADFNRFPIGQAAIHWHGKPTHPHLPDLQSVRVMAAFRGLGIGARLLQACEQLVRERRFSQVSLAVGISNGAARRLYERLGYHAAGEPYTDIWHYTNAQGDTVRVEELVMDMIKML